jgi:hypothetical protein
MGTGTGEYVCNLNKSNWNRLTMDASPPSEQFSVLIPIEFNSNPRISYGPPA